MTETGVTSRRTKRVALAAISLILLAGCTPAEGAFWKGWFASDPTSAERGWETYEASQGGGGSPRPAVAPMGSKCGQWFDEAMSAGWSYASWRQLDKIMWRESRCTPGVRNRSSGSTGLLQIMPMWADDCGTTVSGLQNAAVNLRCGRHILDAQGWSAWAL